jgi:hypothetical protein
MSGKTDTVPVKRDTVSVKRDTVSGKQKVTTCMVVGDSVLGNVGSEHADLKVESFQGITVEQLH